MDEHLQHSAGHEETDAGVRPILYTGIGLAILAAFVCAVVYGIFDYLAAHPATVAPANPMASAAPQVPPEPRIEEHPAIQLQDLHQREDSILSTYGWSDKKAGIVRVPVDRAMEIMLQRGFPARKEEKQK